MPSRDEAAPQRREGADRGGLSRRVFLGAGLAGLTGVVGGRWLWQRSEQGWRAEVLVARAAHYEIDLAELIVSGLAELGVGAAEVSGRRILLKPNMVEPFSGSGHINTHPRVVGGAIQAFLRLGAESILVGDGPGHRRDSLLVLDESGLGQVLREEHIRYVDLNQDAVYSVPNAGTGQPLETLTLPRTLREVDWVVSMPKLKTHHYAGATLSMKNLFGLMPGIVYGWPKNVLHWAGIQRSILDISATVRPQLAIVDGIIGMEGDGPIMGTPKQAGVIVMGRNPPAVDATCCRIMGIDPWRLPYLSVASGWLGPVKDSHIEQRGERIDGVRTDFRLVDGIPAFQGIRLG